MSDSPDGDRQHEATPTQIARAQAAGQVYRSQSLAVAIQLILQLSSSLMLLAGLGSGLILWTQHYWSQPVYHWQQLESTTSQAGMLLRFAGGPLVASLLVVWLSGWCSWLLQIGWQFGKRPLAHWGSWQPSQMASSLWSREKWYSQAIGLGQFGLCLITCIYYGLGDWRSLLDMYRCAPQDWGAALQSSVLRQLLPLLAIIVLGSALDWWCQRQLYYQRLAMTDEQLRDEQRADGGSLATRNRMRQRSNRHSANPNFASTSAAQVHSIDQIRS